VTRKKLLAWTAAGAVVLGALTFLIWLDPGRSAALPYGAAVFAGVLGAALFVSADIGLNGGLPLDRREKIERRIEDLERWHKSWDAEHDRGGRA